MLSNEYIQYKLNDYLIIFVTVEFILRNYKKNSSSNNSFKTFNFFPCSRKNKTKKKQKGREEIIVTIPCSFFRHPPASTCEAEAQFSYLTTRLQSS